MNSLYRSPRMRHAALMRTIHSRRYSRFFALRSRNANLRARISVTIACRYRLCRLARNPFVSFRVRFLRAAVVALLRARTMTPAPQNSVW